MVVFDVWLQRWEVGCCRGLPRPGDVWESILTFSGETGPASDEKLRRLGYGEAAFSGPVVQWVDDGPYRLGVVRATPTLVIIEGHPGIGEFVGGTGRLFEENHAEYTAPGLFSHGVVRRAWVVPQIDGAFSTDVGLAA